MPVANSMMGLVTFFASSEVTTTATIRSAAYMFRLVSSGTVRAWRPCRRIGAAPRNRPDQLGRRRAAPGRADHADSSRRIADRRPQYGRSTSIVRRALVRPVSGLRTLDGVGAFE